MDKSIEGHKTKSHCNRCGGGTNHIVLHREVDEFEDEVDNGRHTVSGGDSYELLKCCGCDSVHLRHHSWFSEDPDGPTVRYYPPIVSRSKPDWLHVFGPVPVSLTNLLKEIYEALHSSSRRLVAMGIRSLVEAVMVQEVGDQGTFRANLDELHAKGLISERDRDGLEKIIEAGHAAMHRQYVPDTEDLKTLLDITEALLATVYVHPERSAELKKRIPPRV